MTTYKITQWLILAIFCLLQSSCFKTCPVNTDCALAPDVGPCKAAIVKYYYDHEEQKCKEFVWGGCFGLVPFDKLEDCTICECNQ